MFLRGEKIGLRAMEPSDLKWLYAWENHPDVWAISELPAPYSQYVISEFLKTAHLDIYTTRQMRLIIVALHTRKIAGIIDLFAFDPLHARAGVGILIAPQWREQHFATEAITLLKKYTFEALHLHQLYCDIETENIASIQLFEKCGFQYVGVKKEWKKRIEGFSDVAIYQCINHDSKR